VTLGVQEGTAFEVLAGLQGNEILAASNLPEITTGVKVVELVTGENPPGNRGEANASGVAAPTGEGQSRGGRGRGQRRGDGGEE
jgi:hypothetical protein